MQRKNIIRIDKCVLKGGFKGIWKKNRIKLLPNAVLTVFSICQKYLTDKVTTIIGLVDKEDIQSIAVADKFRGLKILESSTILSEII